MKYSKDEFIWFCKLYEKANGFEYDEKNLEEMETGFSYQATFRDEYNYKIPFKIYLDDGNIHWEEPEFFEDEEDDTKPFFHSLINETFQKLNNRKIN